MEYCNAGHNAPILRRLDEANNINVGFMKPKVNIALGVLEDFPYEKDEMTLKKGEAVFMYTDGVTEAENADKELFGDEATLSALALARSKNLHTSKEFVEFVYEKVKEHAGNVDQSDDITMVGLEYKGSIGA